MNTNKKIVMVVMMLLSCLVMASSAFAAEQISALNVEFISQSPDPVEPGKFVELRWRVVNEGGKTENYIFELNAEYPFTLDDACTNKTSLKCSPLMEVLFEARKYSTSSPV